MLLPCTGTKIVYFVALAYEVVSGLKKNKQLLKFPINIDKYTYTQKTV